VIYDLSLDIESLLQAAGYPLRVVYGPERVKRETFENAVVFERDRTANDAFLPPAGWQRNARYEAIRLIPAVARIYAQSAEDGATIGDHERVCEKWVDAVYVALMHWAKATKARIEVTSSKMLTADELDMSGKEIWSGVSYELRFSVARGVRDYRFTNERSAGDAKPTGTPTGIANQTRAQYEFSETPPVVGCDSLEE
jgi:hypothetical protein